MFKVHYYLQVLIYNIIRDSLIHTYMDLYKYISNFAISSPADCSRERDDIRGFSARISQNKKAVRVTTL